MLGQNGAWFTIWSSSNIAPALLEEEGGVGVESTLNSLTSTSNRNVVNSANLNEDDLVDRLLTQFPPYGSKQMHQPAPEWFNHLDLSYRVEESKAEVPVVTVEPVSVPPSDEWDPEEKELWKSEAKSEPASTANQVQTEEVASDRQHWMPDQLCKQCYACELPFTVFRRRHHCRLCGQVFCNSCSAYFVAYKNSTVRVCRDCNTQVTQQGGVVDEVQHESPAELTRKESISLLPVEPDPSASLLGTLNHRRLNVDSKEARELEEKERQDIMESLPSPQQTRHKMHRSISSSTLLSAHANVLSAEESLLTGRSASAIAAIRTGNRHLGSIAAAHLEQVSNDLLKTHAPLLWNGLSEDLRKEWTNTLLALATRCCATVEPNVKKGDLLDIRPYCKIKTIPGGSNQDCAYLSGVLFRKTVSHKQMAREIENPRIMLLNGGIEFTRTENRIASLETLFEQEEKYMEILMGKILKHKPDVLLVGKSVSRIGQELMLKAGVVLIQHVKPALLSRISRQTGATIISSTDHVMGQFKNVLGKCHRFRLATFRDNEAWVDVDDGDKRSIQSLLADPGLSVPERQAALAANKLGERVLDGSEAVKAGLAKRGVANNYVMFEGCPKHLGCTVVLRGANRAALKQVKVVFRFLINVAYNLRLETSYLRERGARIRPDFENNPKFTYSSSLCVDFGAPPAGKKIRPWNGGGSNENLPKIEAGEITAFDHQAILITSIWMTEKTQCCPAEVKGICYYSLQDVALGQFLRDSCFNLSLKCQNPNCKKSVLDHSLSFVHNDGLLNITVEELDEELPPSPSERPKKEPEGTQKASEKDNGEEPEVDFPIATWTFCKHCQKVVTPLVYISESTWKFSFGKFLEVFFYNRDAIMNGPEFNCSCSMQSSTWLYFGCGKLAARFNYEPVRPFGVFVRRNLPMQADFLKAEALRRLELMSSCSTKLFVKFDKHIERVSREARNLFNSPVNRPEHLQTVLSALNKMGSDVDHAAKTLQEKIASASDSCRQMSEKDMMNDALFRFPWSARRYLFMLTSAWNEKLSAIGSAVSTMKKLSASSSRNDGVIGQNVGIVGDPLNDTLAESMRRLRKLNEQYARYNVTDITQVLPTLPGTDVHDGDYDDEFDDPDVSIDFSEGVDADVVASRRRLRTMHSSQSQPSLPRGRDRPTKSLGTRRNEGSSSGPESINVDSQQPKSTPGGAVKSAITRFFNRGGREYDEYTVDLGIFAEGRPRLTPGLNNVIVPVLDEHLSTIIAYSLASVDYAKQFKHFSKHDSTGASDPMSTSSNDRGRGAPLDGNSERQRSNSAGPGEILPPSPSSNQATARTGASDVYKDIERRMLVRNKSHIKHTFRDADEKGQVTCKFVCTTYWATQFQAVRQIFLSKSNGKLEPLDSDPEEVEQGYIESLSSAYLWNASGGKSGASFARTSDDRFVIKCISRTELQMFLDCAPAYFEYLSKAFFHGLPTVLCKIVGVYQIGVHNRETGKRSMEQVAVMQNIFYNRKITRVFDLKGSLRGRFAAHVQNSKDGNPGTPSNTSESASANRNRRKDAWSDDSTNKDFDETDHSREATSEEETTEVRNVIKTLLDGDFLEFTNGRPMPMSDRAKAVFQMSILNDTLFLSIINVLDYSILVGVDEEHRELVVGIIDFMRQYDILKQMERVGKSLPMVVGSEAPTIIQPPLYKARFTNAMERYFMTVPSKWTAI